MCDVLKRYGYRIVEPSMAKKPSAASGTPRT
jgi:hypothetical protein